MSNRIQYSLRWLLIALASGTLLFQSSCSTAAATGVAGWLSSISDALISSLVNKAMGVDSSLYSLGT